MSDSIVKLKKRLRGDIWFLWIVMFIVIGLAGYFAFIAIYCGGKPAADFEVKMTMDAEENQYYALFIAGEEMTPVNYNEYVPLNNGIDEHLAIKNRCVVKESQKVVRCVIIAVVLFTLIMLFSYVKKEESPFQRKCVNALRIAAVSVILLGMLPEAVGFFLNSILNLSAEIAIYLEPTSIFVIVIGVVIGMISEIFHYGCMLQEDVDSIA